MGVSQVVKQKILVIEDEPTIAMMIKSRLESHGYQVDVSHRGEDGLNKLQSNPVDLVVLDVILPGISGYEVCANIKGDKNLSIPVIMLTSRNKMIDEKLGFMCKADAYIRKPQSSEYLLPEIERLLSRQSSKPE